MTTASPLVDLKVVDLGQWMAGPAAARLLADNGAEVWHVDPPGGWRWTPETDAVLNHGKHRVELDFDDAAQLAQIRRLIAEADVVIENFRPGALDRFGLDAATVRAAHPGIVYLSLPGFASTDEEHADVQAFEAIIASATGQFSDMGVNRVLMGIPASFSPLPLGSAYAAVYGAMAVGLALRARLGHGQGDHIEVPIASSLLEALAYNSMHVDQVPRRYLSRRELAIEAGARDLDYAQVQTLLDPFYRTYWCADDRPFYLVAVSNRRHPRTVLEVLGIWDDAVAAGLPTHDPYLPTSRWPDGADCTLLAHPISTRWADWLSQRIAARLRTRPSTDWEPLFAAHGIPAIATRTTSEWLATAHPLAAGLLVDDVDPRLGSVRRMGPVLWVTDRAQPTLGNAGGSGAPADAVDQEDTASSQPGYRRRSLPQDPAAGWLEGVTVLDLTNVIAGPTISAALARYGARVIKVDLPTPTFDPWNTILCGIHSNRGKESLLLDSRTELGRPVLTELLQQADVVTVNASQAQLARLGLTGHDLAQSAPHVVLCHLDAWSGPAGGPWSQWPGYDDLVQAATGIMARFGGSLDTPEEHAHFGTIDVLAGLAAATATAFALYAREATGQVLVARSSLAAAGQLIQAPYLCRHDETMAGEPSDPLVASEPAGPQARGVNARYRLYRTRDGWAFLVIPAAALAALGRTLDLPGHRGVPDVGALDDVDLAGAISTVLAEETTDTWRHRLASLGISVQPLRSLSHVRAHHTDPRSDQPWSGSSYQFTVTLDHPVGHPVTLVAPIAVRPATARVVVPTVAPKYGAQTIELLTAAACSPDQIDALIDAGVAGLSYSDEYLPS